ncbi:bifunctional metallophosphatase/5'-nucleotidase [Arcanobacterium hippocoleae]|uniref:bifunctional metallophosphatase/5'-nucleotidase n=1 Tax=Arcanobacterium hippocoleae TaxID=149017 RepID=UPI00333F8FD3
MDFPSGVKVAFIGAIEDDVATKLAPGTVDELTFEKPAPVINKIAENLKTSKQADIVIAMFDNDVERSYPLMGEHVDGIMGGDTHKPYYFTQVKASDGHTLSATASGSFTDNLSNLQFVYDKQTGKVVSSKAIQISADTVAACGTDPKVEAIVSAATKKAEAKKSEVVARNFANFYRGVQAQGENRGTESTLGGLIADSMKHSFKQLDGKPIDIGIINAGGIRADLVPQDGNLTVGDIFATQPFSNEVGYVKMTGAQFKTLLEQQWKKLGKNSSRPMLKLGLSANVKYTFDPTKPMGERITSILVDGKQIDPAKVYSVGSVTFLLAGGDSFDILKDPSIAKTLTPIAENLDRDSFQKYLAANPQVQPRSAVSSVGVTLNHQIDGLKVTASVDLRGLSFSHESEAQTKKVTVKLGTASATADVNNTLEDANAAKENAIVTADGVGYLNKPIELTTTAKCAANAKSVFIPLTVLNEKGVELVSAAAGIGVHVPCPHAAAKPGTSSGNANIVGITNNAGATSAVVDTNANNGQAKATNPRLAKTGSEAAGLLALALLAGILGLAGVAAARRKNA